MLPPLLLRFFSRVLCSGIAAVLAANIVIAAYVVMALREDSGDTTIRRQPSVKPAKVD